MWATFKRIQAARNMVLKRVQSAQQMDGRNEGGVIWHNTKTTDRAGRVKLQNNK